MVIPLTPSRSVSSDPLDVVGRQDRSSGSNRPYVLANMVSSMDGAIAVDGRSGGLGGPADVKMLLALRSVADVIIAGAGTVREERYKPPQPSDTVRALRLERDQSERPLVAVVTRSARLSPDLPLFSDPTYRPLIIAGSDADEDALEKLAEVGTIAQTDTGSVRPESALAILYERGHRIALLEGGPKLNGSFVEADCIDEWNLTISPNLVGGNTGRASLGESGVLHRFEVQHILTADGFLFLQWRRSNDT